MEKHSCDADKCWCVNDGGSGECWARDDCNGNGYWCKGEGISNAYLHFKLTHRIAYLLYYINILVAEVIYLPIFSLEPDCKCDYRGKQYHKDGDWCWLATAPCKFLDNSIAPSDWNWADCVYDGKNMIDCDAPGK